jgi:hypothetical protein
MPRKTENGFVAKPNFCSKNFARRLEVLKKIAPKHETNLFFLEVTFSKNWQFYVLNLKLVRTVLFNVDCGTLNCQIAQFILLNFAKKTPEHLSVTDNLQCFPFTNVTGLFRLISLVAEHFLGG